MKMEPTRKLNATLVDLLDRVLEKGLIINADIIISVAGIPLIGVTLKAALAGMETMLKYGMMTEWDEAQRAIAREEYGKKEIILLEGEKILLKTFGSHWYSKGIYRTWRPGQFYVTDKRIFLYRKEPAEMLLDINLAQIKGLLVQKKKHFDMEREELYIELKTQEIVRLYTRDNVKNLIEEKIKDNGFVLEEVKIPGFSETIEFLGKDEKVTHTGKMWYKEPGDGILGNTWKPGYLYLTNKNLYWYNHFDEKVKLQIPVNKIEKADVEEGKQYNTHKNVLVVSYDSINKTSNNGAAYFSQEEDMLKEWHKELSGKIILKEKIAA